MFKCTRLPSVGTIHCNLKVFFNYTIYIVKELVSPSSQASLAIFEIADAIGG